VPPPPPASPLDIAQQIADATRVVSDASEATPGKLVHVEIIPGFSPALPTSSTLTLTVGTLGALSGAISTLIDSIRIGVKITVTQGGNPATPGVDFIATPALGNTGTSCDSATIDTTGNLTTTPDPLSLTFLLRPPIGEDINVGMPALDYVIDINLCINVEGVTLNKDIQIPISVPAIPIPVILVLGKHANFGVGDDAWLFVMVQAGSPIKSLDQVITTFNSLARVIRSLEALFSFASDFIHAVSLAATAISTIPSVFFHQGGFVSDMDDAAGSDIDDEASAALIIGLGVGTVGTSPNPINVTLTGQPTAVTFYSDTGFEDDHVTFTVTELLPGSVLGIAKQLNFSGMHWDTSSDTINDAIEGFRFGPA
jgi:hypothetical protein